MTTSSLTSRNMLQLLLRRPHVARGCVVVASHKRAASSSEASKESSGSGGGGFFGTFFDKRQDILPQTTAHSAQLSMTRHGEFDTERAQKQLKMHALRDLRPRGIPRPYWPKFDQVPR